MASPCMKDHNYYSAYTKMQKSHDKLDKPAHQRQNDGVRWVSIDGRVTESLRQQ